jgi:mRNA-degrading endonuclease RelE of RelBE toxin-antitoxin system
LIPYTLIWGAAAVAGLARIRDLDPDAAKIVRAAVRGLATEPRPSNSSPLGTAGHRRLRLGDVRVLYQVDDELRAVEIVTVGQVRR